MATRKQLKSWSTAAGLYCTNYRELGDDDPVLWPHDALCRRGIGRSSPQLGPL